MGWRPTCSRNLGESLEHMYTRRTKPRAFQNKDGLKELRERERDGKKDEWPTEQGKKKEAKDNTIWIFFFVLFSKLDGSFVHDRGLAKENQ